MVPDLCRRCRPALLLKEGAGLERDFADARLFPEEVGVVSGLGGTAAIDHRQQQPDAQQKAAGARSQDADNANLVNPLQ